MPAPVSYAVLAVCVALFVLANALRLIPAQALVFSPGNGLVFPGLITHMFAHGSAMHLLGNMAVLFFLGTLVERRYGSGKYAALYFVSGLFAALAEGAVAPGGYLLGASGALAGVMAAFVRHYPRAMLFIYGVLPMPAWLFIVLWLGYNMWGASTGAAGGLQIAFAAHLAGFCAGMVLSLLLVPPRRHGARS
jgi:membrane associated rhomboid family serine protease